MLQLSIMFLLVMAAAFLMGRTPPPGPADEIVWRRVNKVAGVILITIAIGVVGLFLFVLGGIALACADRNWCSCGPEGDAWMLPLFLAFPAFPAGAFLLGVVFRPRR